MNNSKVVDIRDDTTIFLFKSQSQLYSYAFGNYEAAVMAGIEKLAKHGPTDLVIATPLKDRANLRVFFSALENLALAGLKVGVLVGLDRNTDFFWQCDLKEQLKQMQASKRFVFCDFIHTPINGSEITKILGYNFYARQLRQIFADMGFNGYNGNMIIFTVTREIMRLICKRLETKYILWLDADEQPPQDAIPRLLKHLQQDNVGMAAGWALDRHYPYLKPKVEPAKNYEPENEQEASWHKHAIEFDNNLKSKIRSLVRLGTTGQFILEQDHETRFISPYRLWRENKPIEVTEVGFGCAMFKKAVNDYCSFVPPEGAMTSEDYNFCDEARKFGYKLLVDPLVFCKHIGVEIQPIKT